MVGISLAKRRYKFEIIQRNRYYNLLTYSQKSKLRENRTHKYSLVSHADLVKYYQAEEIVVQADYFFVAE